LPFGLSGASVKKVSEASPSGFFAFTPGPTFPHQNPLLANSPDVFLIVTLKNLLKKPYLNAKSANLWVFFSGPFIRVSKIKPAPNQSSFLL